MAVQLEDILKELPPVTTMIKEGMTAEDILFRVTEGFSMVCENKAVVPEYKCTCSKERMEKALISIGKKELEELIEDQGEAELTCSSVIINTISIRKNSKIYWKKQNK